MGFLSDHSTELVFGLGRGTAVLAVHVEWLDGRSTTVLGSEVVDGRAVVRLP